MTGQQILTVGAIIIALASAGASSCKVKQAQEAANFARSEAEALRARLEAAESENAAQREILARAYEAVNRASEAVGEAAKSHAERIETIDSADSDWLMCPLPDGVRNAFKNGNPD